MVYNTPYTIQNQQNIASYSMIDKFSQIERITMYIDDALIIFGELMTIAKYAVYYDYDEMHTYVIIAINGMKPSAYRLDTYEIGNSKEKLKENINSAIYTKFKSKAKAEDLVNGRIKFDIKKDLDYKNLIIMNGV